MPELIAALNILLTNVSPLKVCLHCINFDRYSNCQTNIEFVQFASFHSRSA